MRVVARTGMTRILFQVAIGIRRKTPQIIERGQPLVARFTENLTPGGWIEPGEGPSRGLLRDCEICTNLRIAFVSSSSFNIQLKQR